MPGIKTHVKVSFKTQKEFEEFLKRGNKPMSEDTRKRLEKANQTKINRTTKVNK